MRSALSLVKGSDRVGRTKEASPSRCQTEDVAGTHRFLHCKSFVRTRVAGPRDQTVLTFNSFASLSFVCDFREQYDTPMHIQAISEQTTIPDDARPIGGWRSGLLAGIVIARESDGLKQRDLHFADR